MVGLLTLAALLVAGGHQTVMLKAQDAVEGRVGFDDATLLVWEAWVRLGNVSQMIMPRPSHIAVALVDGFRNNVFQRHLLVTAQVG